MPLQHLNIKIQAHGVGFAANCHDLLIPKLMKHARNSATISPSGQHTPTKATSESFPSLRFP